jgi:tRNA dimethylallyltransferase
VLTGPTATGKTAAAIRLGRHLPVEVINADSRLFYRGMDIGVAKPTPAERAAVPHHLIDILDPAETPTLAWFQDTAYRLIRAIHTRHVLPLLAGGTQQYVNAVVEGWRIPRVAPQPALRAELEAEAEANGREHLLARLRALDPAAADSTGPNLRRIVRALEVIAVTGRPISEQQGKEEPWFASLLLGLTMSRETLYPRIDARTEAMIDAGLVDEVRGLLARGVPPESPSLGSIGYRQVLPLLRDEATLAETAARIRHDTHRLVRHQETWLRKTPGLVAVDVSEDGWFERMLATIEAFLAEHPIP